MRVPETPPLGTGRGFVFGKWMRRSARRHLRAPGAGGRRREAHSMRASAQVTAPGATTSIIVAASTRPNRQNRSTCSRMSVPLVQKQKLGVVNRFSRRAGRSQMAVRPRHDHQDGRHEDRRERPEGRSEPSWFWFRCPVPFLTPVPLVPVLVLVLAYRGANRERCVIYFTLPLVVPGIVVGTRLSNLSTQGELIMTNRRRSATAR